jgi:polyisoprenoid-binding protein YceI
MQFAAMFTFFAFVACKQKRPPTPEPPAPSATPAAGTVRFNVDPTGSVSYLIDAPVEKGKGQWTKFRGELDIDITDLSKTRGRIDMDLDDLKTSTFDDPGQNGAQTEHAHNWFEIGSDVRGEVMEKNRWAHFTITRVEDAAPMRLADAPDNDGRKITAAVKGDLWLHGVSAPKTVKLEAVFIGSATAPNALRIRTLEPFEVSLQQHDVKPRDALGKFISGSLEVVFRNKKIVDTARVSIDNLTLQPGSP